MIDSEGIDKWKEGVTVVIRNSMFAQIVMHDNIKKEDLHFRSLYLHRYDYIKLA